MTNNISTNSSAPVVVVALSPDSTQLSPDVLRYKTCYPLSIYYIASDSRKEIVIKLLAKQIHKIQQHV